ncbi:MAG: flavin reductase family protein [Caldilineaceae bacterium]|nr:flavin reductase family protein [Caldilineaceae bacterium]
MKKRIFEPNTTLFPVPVVLITTGGDTPNVITLNRIASCSAEPPRISISVRPLRHSHALIKNSGEFVVNIPTPAQQLVSDYVGVVSGRAEDKFATTNLHLAPAAKVKTPLLADCPVNIECIVEQAVNLDSHTMFIGLVQAVHVDESLLDGRGEVDFARAHGLIYQAGVVRERPTYNFRVAELRQAVR